MSHAGKLSKTPTRLSFLAAIERLNNREGGRDECETVPRLWGPRLIAIRAVQMATRGRSLIVVHLRSLSWKSLSEGALGRRIIEYDVKVSIVLRIRAFKGARWKLGQIAINLVQRERERGSVVREQLNERTCWKGQARQLKRDPSLRRRSWEREEEGGGWWPSLRTKTVWLVVVKEEEEEEEESLELSGFSMKLRTVERFYADWRHGVAVCALDFLGPGNRFVNIIGNEGMDEIRARNIKIAQTRSKVNCNWKL